MTFSAREVNLGDVCEIKQGRYLAPKDMESMPTAESSVAVVGGNGILGYTNETTFGFSVPLVTCRGSKCGLMQWAESPTWISNNAMAVYFKEGLGDNFYLHQYLLSQSFEDVTTGSAQPQITVTNLSQKKILLPDVVTQKFVSQVMKALDSKIELNKQLSKTLEDIAQAIFKSWFIDFDPVKAKVAGEKPVGMDDATAALFPDSMEDSELGLIPRGWLVEALSGLVQVLSGGTPKTTNAAYWSGDIPWFSVADVPQGGGVFFIKTAKTITSAGVQNSAAKLARPGITIISARGTVGKTVLVATPSTFNQSCYGVEGKYGDYFTFLLIRSQITRLQNLSHGAMFDTITRDTFSAIQVTRAPEELISEFEKLVRPTYELIRNTQLESESLIGIRDSLLPRLISGDLQIPEEMLAS
jgi:type I restriction enzyme S subunit